LPVFVGPNHAPNAVGDIGSVQFGVCSALHTFYSGFIRGNLVSTGRKEERPRSLCASVKARAFSRAFVSMICLRDGRSTNGVQAGH
jgi:hypothetical protein